MAAKKEVWATGKRKTAVARVKMRPGTGKIKVNKKNLEDVFTTEALQGFIKQPLSVTNTMTKYNIWINVRGGGPAGQAGAVRHGIAKCLALADESLKPLLKDCGMLTRDARVKERKKAGQPGARKRFQFSKR